MLRKWQKWRQPFTILLLLVLLLLAGIWTQADSVFDLSPRIAPSVAAASAAPSALWVMTMGGMGSEGDAFGAFYNPPRMVAVNPFSGEMLAELRANRNASVVSSDGLVQYNVDEVHSLDTDGRWDLNVTAIDLARGAITKILSPYALMPRPAIDPDPTIRLALTQDKRRLVITVLSNIGILWCTQVLVVDTTTFKTPGTPICLFPETATGTKPNIGTYLTPDGTKLVVVHHYQKQTRLVTVDLATGWTGDYGDVSKDFDGMEGEPRVLLALNGQTLYLYSTLYNSRSQSGYRWLAYDLVGAKTALIANVDRGSGGEPFCNFDGARFTKDGLFLYAFCYPGPGDTRYYFQFLDTRTGLVTNKVVPDSVPPGESVLSVTASPDGRFEYVILDGQVPQIASLDVQRKNLRQNAVVLGPVGALDAFGSIADLLVSRASAKGEEFFSEKRAAISPDGSHLYYVHSNEHNNEVWAFETANLKLVGRWLTGKEVVALQTSMDGSVLYAVSSREGALYVLDALTGKVNRAFPKLFSSPYGFAP